MTALLLVEDHVALAGQVARYLQEQGNVDVAAVAHSGEEALVKLPHLAVDLVLVDVMLSGMSGIDLVVALGEQCPHLPCIMLSGLDELSYVRQALDAGARGFVVKDEPLALLEAIQSVLDGEIYLSKDLRA